MGRDVRPTAEDGPPDPEGADPPKAKIRGTDPVAVEPCTIEPPIVTSLIRRGPDTSKLSR